MAEEGRWVAPHQPVPPATNTGATDGPRPWAPPRRCQAAMPCMFPTRLPWTVAIQLAGQLTFLLSARGGLACAVMADPSLAAQARAWGQSAGGWGGQPVAADLRAPEGALPPAGQMERALASHAPVLPPSLDPSPCLPPSLGPSPCLPPSLDPSPCLPPSLGPGPRRAPLASPPKLPTRSTPSSRGTPHSRPPRPWPALPPSPAGA
jgi:hypothetical protein